MFAFRLFAAVAKAVVASWVVFVPAVAVGAVGVPVNAGETSGAREVNCVPLSFSNCPVVPSNRAMSRFTEIFGPTTLPNPVPELAPVRLNRETRNRYQVGSTDPLGVVIGSVGAGMFAALLMCAPC
jgi:hypothetical protein